MSKLIGHILLLPFYMIMLMLMVFSRAVKAMVWLVVILFGIMLI